MQSPCNDVDNKHEKSLFGDLCVHIYASVLKNQLKLYNQLLFMSNGHKCSLLPSKTRDTSLNWLDIDDLQEALIFAPPEILKEIDSKAVPYALLLFNVSTGHPKGQFASAIWSRITLLCIEIQQKHILPIPMQQRCWFIMFLPYKTQWRYLKQTSMFLFNGNWLHTHWCRISEFHHCDVRISFIFIAVIFFRIINFMWKVIAEYITEYPIQNIQLLIIPIIVLSLKTARCEKCVVMGTFIYIYAHFWNLNQSLLKSIQIRDVTMTKIEMQIQKIFVDRNTWIFVKNMSTVIPKGASIVRRPFVPRPSPPPLRCPASMSWGGTPSPRWSLHILGKVTVYTAGAIIIFFKLICVRYCTKKYLYHMCSEIIKFCIPTTSMINISILLKYFYAC